MDTTQILTGLRAEVSRLTHAIATIAGLGSSGTRRGRPPKSAIPAATIAAPKRRGRRRMSAAGRKRISDAAKAMWARRKKAAAGKKTPAAKKAAPARHMSAAARKRISEAAKARWAARKKAKTV